MNIPLTFEFLHTLQLTNLVTRIKKIKTLEALLRLTYVWG
jgi:hypothetical protein